MGAVDLGVIESLVILVGYAFGLGGFCRQNFLGVAVGL